MKSIQSPLCPISNQISTKVCVNTNCTHPAFICKYCDQEDCQKLHYHNHKLQIMQWSQFKILIQDIQVPTYSQQLQKTTNKIQKDINKLLDEVNNIMCDTFIKMDTQFNNIWKKIKEERWNLITGSQIRKMQDVLKSNNYIKNKQEVALMKGKETENVKILINSIRQKLNSYFKVDILKNLQNWSEEDQQKLLNINDKIKEQLKNAEHYCYRGWLYYCHKQYDKAMKDYNKAILLDNRLAIAYNRRGIIYYDRKQLQKALNQYNKSIECDPNLAIAYNNRGIIYYNNKQFKKALMDYNKAIECNPQYSNAYYNRGVIYLNNNQLQQAFNDYSKAIEYDPKHSMAYNGRGLIYYNQNQLKKALEDYNKAIACNNSDACYFLNRAIIYRKLNMMKEAECDEKRAKELQKY